MTRATRRHLFTLGILGSLAAACRPSTPASPFAPAVVAASPAASSPPAPLSPPLRAEASPAPPPSAPPPLATMPDDVARVVAFVEGLPTCAPDGAEVSLEIALSRMRSPHTPPIRAIRGRLVLRPEGCTEMGCDDACCNACGGSWSLASADGSLRAALSMQWSVSECHVGALTARLGARVDVVAKGTLRDAPTHPGGVQAQLVDARLCVVVVRTAR
jgi:hypothetical protein